MKILLFDLDGTLVHAGGAGKRALNKAMKHLYGVSDACDRVDLSGRTDLDNFTLAYQRNLHKKPSSREVTRIGSTYLKYLPGEVKRALRHKRYRPLPGIRRFLYLLSRKPGVLVGLGTGNIEKGAWVKLKPSGLNKYFSFGGFGADHRHRARMLKMAVARAKKLIKKKGTDPFFYNDVFVIGDTHLDVLAGKKAGYKTIAITSGFGDIKQIIKARPNFVARDFRNRKVWFRWLGI
ncbi:MAG: HAD family hydrolase [Elusimicrobia bacterium]|nr:HAD family hydrolase [Elusimicrobiota bacterium]